MSEVGPQREFLHPGDVAERLGVTVRTVHNMRAAGDLPPFVRISRQRVGIPIEAWGAWRASRQAAA